MTISANPKVFHQMLLATTVAQDRLPTNPVLNIILRRPRRDFDMRQARSTTSRNVQPCAGWLLLRPRLSLSEFPLFFVPFTLPFFPLAPSFQDRLLQDSGSAVCDSSSPSHRCSDYLCLLALLPLLSAFSTLPRCTPLQLS